LLPTNPPYPLKGKQPLFFALRAFLRGKGGGARFNPWIYASGALKSLIVDRNAPTGFLLLSTCLHSLSTGLAHISTYVIFATAAPLSIYLFILKRRRRREEAESKKAGIHGFSHLPIFSSTDLPPCPRLSRGFPWMVFICYINKLDVFEGLSTHPRVVLRVGTFDFSAGGFGIE
jgi:hypothetical protein